MHKEPHAYICNHNIPKARQEMETEESLEADMPEEQEALSQASKVEGGDPLSRLPAHILCGSCSITQGYAHT